MLFGDYTYDVTGWNFFIGITKYGWNFFIAMYMFFCQHTSIAEYDWKFFIVMFILSRKNIKH